MRCVNRIAGLLALALALSRAQAVDPDFSRPNNFLGNADNDGNFCLWVNVAAATLKDGTQLPLRFRFDGGSTSGFPLFGRYWWCPVLESTIYPLREDLQFFTTLGGRGIYLSLWKDGTLVSPDGAYKGRVVSPSTSAVSGGGWDYTYVNGRLREARKSDGSVDLEWLYQGSKLTSVSYKSGNPVFSVEYASGSALPTAVLVEKMRYELKGQQVPVVTQTGGVPMIAGFATTLAQIQNSAATQNFPIRFERDGRYVMDYKSDFWASNSYAWEAASGTIKSDKDWVYEISRMEKETLAVRKNARGGTESYLYDRLAGTGVYQQLDGSVITRQYFLAVGPIQGKIRKMTEVKDGKEIANWQWSYDELGRMIRERSLYDKYEKSDIWGDNGKLVSETIYSDGKEFAKKVYDPSGRLIENARGRFDDHYVYQEGKTLVERSVDGQLQGVIVPGSGKSFGTFFAINGQGQLQAPSFPSVPSTSPQSVSQTLAFANRVLNTAGALKK